MQNISNISQIQLTGLQVKIVENIDGGTVDGTADEGQQVKVIDGGDGDSPSPEEGVEEAAGVLI